MELSEHITQYDILWHFLNAEGRQSALFGTECQGLAREAFMSCSVGSVLPVIYLELPLLGPPCFDLQVCIDRASLTEGVHVLADAPAHEQELLAWLAGPRGSECTGVDLAFDLRDGNTTSPQLIALLNGGSFNSAEEFFALVGAPDGAPRYRAAEQRMPAQWHSWYTGIIPGRPGSPVRLDYQVSRDRVRSYRNDSRLLAQDLARLDYALSDQQRGWCEELLSLPCGLNLQIDARTDGTIGPVLGYNLTQKSMPPGAARKTLENGWRRQAFEICERWSLADDRWHHLLGLCQAKVLPLRDSAGSPQPFVLRVVPTFIKVRMTQDELVDAKVYVIGTLRKAARRVP